MSEQEATKIITKIITKDYNDVGLPEAKKQKTNDKMTSTETKPEVTKDTVAESPDSEWPEAWYMMEDGTYEDQKERNRLSPNKPATVESLRKLGIQYWKMDAETYTYPPKAIPWDPKDAADPKLMAIRDDRGYSYADIISVRPDLLPGYDQKIKAFFEEHIHDAEEIRYILDGSGYFDIRDKEDKWIRIWIKKGDLMTLPEGCYHRFTCDEKDFIQAMRLFIGQPVWTPFNRPQEEHKSRKFYVDNYVEQEEKKEEA
jgi:1,2-dihydroxy-3-keto-5-methylthiopentene dioxygenase